MRKWIQVLVFLLLPVMVLAKPQPSASLEEGLMQSPYVVIATFKSINPKGADYLSGAESTYLVTEVLKGKIPQGALTMNYAFHDNSACLPIKGWKISQESLPTKDSKWILILKEKGPKARSYRGDFGRIPYTEANITKVGELLGEGC